jgi:hypothetical protein
VASKAAKVTVKSWTNADEVVNDLKVTLARIKGVERREVNAYYLAQVASLDDPVLDHVVERNVDGSGRQYVTFSKRIRPEEECWLRATADASDREGVV